MGEQVMGPETFASLADKLEALGLSDEEEAVLQKLLRRAARYEPEVEGFAMQVGSFRYTGLRSGGDLTGLSRRIATSTGSVDSADGWPPT